MTLGEHNIITINNMLRRFHDQWSPDHGVVPTTSPTAGGCLVDSRRVRVLRPLDPALTRPELQSNICCIYII